MANIGPVSVTIYSSDNFKQYSGGVFVDDSCEFMDSNYAVTLVGYDTDSQSGLDYYILRNQVGTKWGNY